MMIKTKLLIVLLFFSFLLIGCDYPEKSFQALSEHEIPDEVTLDFILPLGVYAPFIWTSSNPNIFEIYDNRFVRIHQQEVDTTVVLTARINKTQRTFTVTVLKSGSEHTMLEQARIVLNEFYLNPEVITPFEVPNQIDNIVLKYEKMYHNQPITIVTKLDGTTWIVPNIVEVSISTTVIVKAYYPDGEQLIYQDSAQKEFRILRDENNENIHKRIFNALEVQYQQGDHQQHVTQDFILPLTSNIEASTMISWQSMSDTYTNLNSDGKTVIVTQPDEYIHQTTFIVTITVDEITHKFNYSITIYPKSR